MKPIDCRSLGWSDYFEGARRQAARPDLLPARIIADHSGSFRIDGATGPTTARLGACPPPCVGDWVLAEPPVGNERARIEVSLVRRTELVRQAAGRRTQRQTVAANIDVVFVVTDMCDDFNLRRLERYIAAVHAGGATPVIVLNKADLTPDRQGRFTRQLDPGWPVVVSSAILDLGIEELRAHLGRGRSAGFVGSSGVGKSSLVNALMGRAEQAVNHKAADGRGQHTTTHRQLVVLPDDDGVLIDTPGMRELALWEGSGVEKVFAELEDLALTCHFRNCRHAEEPGCALRSAVEAGELEEGRLHNWLGLRRQAARQAARRDVVRQRREAKVNAKRIRAAQRSRRD